MLGWALTFFIVALIAAALGFTGIAGAASSVAQVLFFVFLVLLVVAGVASAVRGTAPGLTGGRPPRVRIRACRTPPRRTPRAGCTAS